MTQAVVERLQSKFDDDKIVEFKMLFLLVALDMVLCPTHCSRFPKELLPALACASSPRKFNWCPLVLERLMASAKPFGDRFYSEGFAGGCGGCTLFVVVRLVLLWCSSCDLRILLILIFDFFFF